MVRLEGQGGEIPVAEIGVFLLDGVLLVPAEGFEVELLDDLCQTSVFSLPIFSSLKIL